MTPPAPTASAIAPIASQFKESILPRNEYAVRLHPTLTGSIWTEPREPRCYHGRFARAVWCRLLPPAGRRGYGRGPTDAHSSVRDSRKPRS